MAIENNKFDNSFSKAINWVSLIIILVSLSGLIWIITYLTLHEVKPIKNEIFIETNITRIGIDKYLIKVENKITDLQNVESNLDKKINEINVFYKFLGTIIAIIIALTGFFGFKSLHELKIRNLENARDVAKNEAILKVESVLQNLKEQTTSKINEAKSESKLSLMSDFYKMETQLEALTGNIKEINSRLDLIENLDREFEDFELRLKNLENKSIRKIKESDNNINKSFKVKKTSRIIPNEIVENLNEEEEFGEEGFES